MSGKNLDMKCAKTGNQIGKSGGKEREKLIRLALAILEEQGVYAMFLRLRRERDGSSLTCPLQNLLATAELPGGPGQGNRDILSQDCSLYQDLDRLILARDLLGRALVYGLEHTRFRDNKEQAS